MSHACHCFRKCNKTLACCSLLTRCIIPEACHAKRHLNVKSTPNPYFFTLLTSKCALCHSGMHFFDILTSKLARTLRCFVHVAHFVLPKTISYNMTLEIDLLWALRAAILQGKLEWRERERDIYIYIYIYVFTYLLIHLYLIFVNIIYIYYIYIYTTTPRLHYK